MSKHTPGPWIHPTGVFANETGGPSIQSADGDLIAAVAVVDADLDDETNERRLADAHLIAAAPEMLAALRTQRPIIQKMIRIAQDRMDKFLLNEATEALEALDAAIAKARGEA